MNRRWPAWLAALALGVHLLVPGLCLAQMLSAAPLGAICTSAADRADASPLADADSGRHAFEACDQCVGTAAAIADNAPAVAAWPALQDAPRAAAAAGPIAASTTWRPPPRGPPHAA